MNRRADMIRVAELLAAEFSIYTHDVKRLANFARDLLKSGREWTVYELEIKKSVERVAQW